MKIRCVESREGKRIGKIKSVKEILGKLSEKQGPVAEIGVFVRVYSQRGNWKIYRLY